MKAEKKETKFAVKLAIVLLVIFAGISLNARLQYGLSPVEYIRYSMPLTGEEREYLEQKQNIVFGLDMKAPPLTFFNLQTGQNEGLLVDYMAALSIELGVNVTYRAVPFNQIMSMLDNEEIDMSDLFESTERVKKYAFTQSLYRLRGIAVTLSDRTDMEQSEDLKGKKVGLIRGDFAVEHFEIHFDTEKTGTQIFLVDDMEEGLDLLMEGKIDAFVGDETVIYYYAGENGIEEDIREIGDALYEKNVTFAVKKDDRILLDILNKGILNLKKKDILAQGEQKWFDTTSPVFTDAAWMDWLPLMVVTALILLFVFFKWESVMNRRISEKTKEIQLQKYNLRTVIDNIHTMLLVIDEEQTIVEINRAAEAALCTDGSSLAGKHADSIPLIAVLMDEADRDPKEIYHINGRYYSLLIRNINESAGNRLMMIEDRTDKTLADRRLRQESKMVAVGQLSAGLAHEIRNPMGLIRSYSYILEDYATDEISSHALNVIDESMNRINRLIENLLNFSKPGREAFVMVDIGMLFNNIESLERKKMEKAEIDFRMICPARTEFYTDEEALKVILINLIDNGFEALIRGDASLAHNKMLFCSAKKVKKGLEICIEDNGPGMTEEQQEQVFNPFYTTKDNGTGLGLYLVNAELEKLGGNIRMVSRKGEGTVFTVFLPEAGGN